MHEGLRETLADPTFPLPPGTSWYELLGLAGCLIATALNWAASAALGADYDRLKTPSRLMTSGPYALVQHPIYTSYMLLFVSFGLLMHSAPYAALLWSVSALYYRRRMALEARILASAFGAEYEAYAARTKLLLPGLV